MSIYDIERMADELADKAAHLTRSDKIAELLVGAMFNLLTPNESGLIVCLYDGETLPEIAEKWDVSNQYVHEVRDHLRVKLCKYLNNNGIKIERE